MKIVLMGFMGSGKTKVGELLAAHLTGSPLPSYAPAFALERYQAPEYRKLLESDGGELSTTPMYHPILPLLVDNAAAQEALPGAPLPSLNRSVFIEFRRQIVLMIK